MFVFLLSLFLFFSDFSFLFLFLFCFPPSSHSLTYLIFYFSSTCNTLSGTTLDYTLDQLFIHLDDPSPAMQTAIFSVIIIASKLDSTLVVKKATDNRHSQRTPELCDKILFEVQGFELLPDTDTD